MAARPVLDAGRRPGWSRMAVVLVVGLVAGLVTAAGCSRPPPAPQPSPAPARPGFVVLSDVDSRIRADIRYASTHNFVGQPVAGYAEPLCLLTATAAEALRAVQDAALATGHTLKVYDCYRPQRAADEFRTWAARPDDQQMKAEFYPRVAKSDLFPRGYLGAPSAHSRGSTVDLTLVAVPAPGQARYVPGQPLVACTAPRAERFGDNSVDMGTGFDCFDPLAHTGTTRISVTARENRRLLRQLMTDGGFAGYDREWWHFRYRAEPWPDTYFDLPVTRSSAG
ncbi:D-alanyl-D-alanine dipeptidase [Micromonospora zingiberis]|uniref:D-alanyl-D-alanine dipeptidase n=1 Tax=Micromonospora zingiberis TaxID=2053011 RepID=A0A4R0GXY6_9ACTN|nr:M15 family metallopeptidase [Micromonospora zingiberis]TCC00379.1 D-alanyl-D-alanine dipeptidase [Micromonospora zingiberis]